MREEGWLDITNEEDWGVTCVGGGTTNVGYGLGEALMGISDETWV